MAKFIINKDGIKEILEAPSLFGGYQVLEKDFPHELIEGKTATVTFHIEKSSDKVISIVLSDVIWAEPITIKTRQESAANAATNNKYTLVRTVESPRYHKIFMVFYSKELQTYQIHSGHGTHAVRGNIVAARVAAVRDVAMRQAEWRYSDLQALVLTEKKVSKSAFWDSITVLTALNEVHQLLVSEPGKRKCTPTTLIRRGPA